MVLWNDKKFRIGFAGVAVAFFVTACMAYSQTETILIGDGIRNGDFNDDISGADQRAFSDTPAWTNVAGLQSAIATRTSLDYDGSRNHQVIESKSAVMTLRMLLVITAVLIRPIHRPWIT